MLPLTQEFLHLERHDFGPDRPGPVVLVCADQAYLKYARVTLVSLLLNTEARDFRIVVLGSWSTSKELQEFARLSDRFNACVTLIHVPDDVLPATFTGNAYFSRATYLRLLAPQILDVEWLLYLDSDLIVQAEISALLDLYDPSLTIGAVRDQTGGERHNATLGLAADNDYFNAGVMLMNCRRWRENLVFRRSLEFYRKSKERIVCADQDILNVLLQRDRYSLPDKWNVLATAYQPFSLSAHFKADSFDGIFHFSGEFKPWMRWADPWAREFYLRYARMFGLPDGFWQEPQTIRQMRLVALAAEAEKDFARACSVLKTLVQELVNERERLIRSASVSSCGAGAAP